MVSRLMEKLGFKDILYRSGIALLACAHNHCDCRSYGDKHPQLS